MDLFNQQLGDCFDLNDIQRILPHRGPALKMDMAIYYKPEKEGEKHKLSSFRIIKVDDPDLNGHFGIYPGHCQLECASVASALLAGIVIDVSEVKEILFAGVDKIKYKKIVLPGSVLRIDIELIKNRGGKFFIFDSKIFDFSTNKLVVEIKGLSGVLAIGSK